MLLLPCLFEAYKQDSLAGTYTLCVVVLVSAPAFGTKENMCEDTSDGKCARRVLETNH